MLIKFICIVNYFHGLLGVLREVKLCFDALHNYQRDFICNISFCIRCFHYDFVNLVKHSNQRRRPEWPWCNAQQQWPRWRGSRERARLGSTGTCTATGPSTRWFARSRRSWTRSLQQWAARRTALPFHCTRCTLGGGGGGALSVQCAFVVYVLWLVVHSHCLILTVFFLLSSSNTLFGIWNKYEQAVPAEYITKRILDIGDKCLASHVFPCFLSTFSISFSIFVP